MDRNIFCIGESLLDIIFENNTVVGIKPGGSMLNTAISAAKSGNNVNLISEISNDNAGKIILDNLEKYKVSTRFIQNYKYHKTALALAFLDKNKNAEYSFYKDYPFHRELIQTEFTKNDVILFGSIYSISHEIRFSLLSQLKKAIKNSAVIIYDPNIRKNCIHDNFLNFVNENISLSTIIKASDEDLLNIFGHNNYEKIYHQISENSGKILIITRNKNSVLVFTKNFFYEIEIPEFKPVSTIGAGDAFNAGIIHEIIRQNMYNIDFMNISQDNCKKIIKSGIDFASDVCKTYENTITDDFASELISNRRNDTLKK